MNRVGKGHEGGNGGGRRGSKGALGKKRALDLFVLTHKPMQRLLTQAQ